jgi:uncharacterized protein YeaO (DUF488 family)
LRLRQTDRQNHPDQPDGAIQDEKKMNTMPIQQAIWRLGSESQRLRPSKLSSEKALEDFIAQDPEILSPNWMLIGRQVQTDYRGFVDLIALQPDGTPVIIELKKDRTPREVLAQTLDYASWVEELTPGRLQTMYERFTGNAQSNLNADFEKRFGSELQEEALGRDHLMVIVATELDNSTERIVKFLAKRNLNINVLFFQVFEDELGQLLSRAWLVDPVEGQVTVSSAGEVAGTWNGEFYVSFGEDEARSWEDARKYGFITASGGSWYTQTLGMLNEGDRVWVNIPKQGFVGVGRVTGAAQAIADFEVPVDGTYVPLQDVPELQRYGAAAPLEEQAWFVPVQWIDTVPIAEAIRQVGFFGNQNTVAKPKSEKWEHTVAVLKQRFTIKD